MRIDCPQVFRNLGGPYNGEARLQTSQTPNPANTFHTECDTSRAKRVFGQWPSLYYYIDGDTFIQSDRSLHDQMQVIEH
jgi:hypothetical protein